MTKYMNNNSQNDGLQLCHDCWIIFHNSEKGFNRVQKSHSCDRFLVASFVSFQNNTERSSLWN